MTKPNPSAALQHLKSIVGIARMEAASQVPEALLTKYVPDASRAIGLVRAAINPEVSNGFAKQMQNIGLQMVRSMSDESIRSLSSKYRLAPKSDVSKILTEQTIVVLVDTLNNLNVGYNLRSYQLWDASLGRSFINNDYLIKTLDQNSVDFRSIVAQLGGKFDKLAPVVSELDMRKFSRLTIPKTLGAYIVSAGTNEGFADQANKLLTKVASPYETQQMNQAHLTYKAYIAEVDQLIAGSVPFSLVYQAYQESLQTKKTPPSDKDMNLYFEKVTEEAIKGAQQEWKKTENALQVFSDGKFSELVAFRAEFCMSQNMSKQATPSSKINGAAITIGALAALGNFFKSGSKS